MLIRLNRFALFYPLRIVGAYFVALVVALYSLQLGQFTLYRLLLIGVLLVYPHLVRYYVWRHSEDRLKTELRAFIFDSFIIGLVVHLTGFTPLPTFVLITVALVNALAVNGFGQMFLSASALLAGIALSMLFGGVSEAPSDPVPLDIAVAIFLFVYFTFFGLSVYNSNALLARSRTELREQKSVLEIEKQRSEALLLDLLPSEIAAQFKSSRQVEFTEYDPVTLVAADFCDFSRALETYDAKETLLYLTHCFKAFDAIVGRHGFEKLKTMGDVYIAAAGIPKPDERYAAAGISAALEMRQFITDLNESRRATGKFTLDVRIAVHTGRVIGGIVSTEKMSFDLWGSPMKVLLRQLREAGRGQVRVSDATRRLAGDDFASAHVAAMGKDAVGDIVFCEAEKDAA